MSLPLIAHAGPIGALNMYSETERAFGSLEPRGEQHVAPLKRRSCSQTARRIGIRDC